jgi:hypothetical protein
MPAAVLLMSSCSNFTFKDIEEFEISDGLLKDSEKVKVIYNSGAPDDNLELNYYRHLIVVSQESNDTFNLLSTGDAIVTKTDNIRYYIDNNSSANIIMQNLEKIQNGVNINDLSNKDIKKVVVNNTTAEDTKNDYPTLIGGLANEVKQMADD